MLNDPVLKLAVLRLSYFVLVLLVVMFETLPFSTSPTYFIGPDLALLITLTWIMHRPDVMAPALVALTLLLVDLVLQRPPGLWSLIVLSTGMFLRVRADGLVEGIFLLEWAMASSIIATCYLVYHFALLVTFLPTNDISVVLLQALLTVACYPLSSWVFRRLLRRKPISLNDKNTSRFVR